MRGGSAFSASCQAMMARKVSGLSQSPSIMLSRPASMRLAMAISPSRLSSSTLPISRRYMRTGSSVRPMVSSSTLPPDSSSSFSSPSSALAGLATTPSPSSASSASTTLMPASDRLDSVSSMNSLDTCSCGRAWFTSSTVT
jgi:hypothetical protein